MEVKRDHLSGEVSDQSQSSLVCIHMCENTLKGKAITHTLNCRVTKKKGALTRLSPRAYACRLNPIRKQSEIEAACSSATPRLLCSGRQRRRRGVVFLIHSVQAVSWLNKHGKKLHNERPNYSCSAGLRSGAPGNQHKPSFSNVYLQQARESEADKEPVGGGWRIKEKPASGTDRWGLCGKLVAAGEAN